METLEKYLARIESNLDLLELKRQRENRQLDVDRHVAVWIHDTVRDQKVYVNTGYVKLFGVDLTDLQKDPLCWTRVFCEEDRAERERGYQEVQETGTYEGVVRFKSGQQIFIKTLPIRYNGLVGYVGVAVDTDLLEGT